MRVTITRPIDHAGARYMPGDSVEVDQTAAERLIREGVARVNAAELVRHLRGQRLTVDSTLAQPPRLRR